MSAAVTPLGVRDGDPDAVAALIRRRGAAVLGYCEEVAAPGAAVPAASEAFGSFRDSVADAPDVRSFDAEGELVRATRFAAANHAPQAGRGTPMVPTLLAARAEGDLGPEDEERLTRLLGRSSEARTSADRMRRGEAAYTDPAAALPPRAAGPMVAALATGAAIPATLKILGDGLGWGPEQVDDAVAAAGVTTAPKSPSPSHASATSSRRSRRPPQAARRRRQQQPEQQRRARPSPRRSPRHRRRRPLPHPRRRTTAGAAARAASSSVASSARPRSQPRSWRSRASSAATSPTPSPTTRPP